MRKYRGIWIVLEIAVLAILIGNIVYQGKHFADYNMDLGQWRSEYMVYDGQTWKLSDASADEIYGSLEEDATVCLLYGPFIDLPKGSYTITISYESDGELLLIPYAGNGYNELLQSGDAILSRNQTSESYSVRATEDIPGFEVSIHSSEATQVRITAITIRENSQALWRNFVFVLFLFTLLNIILYKKNWFFNHKKQLICIAGLWLISSLPLFLPGIDDRDGQDLVFHLLRIDGIADGLRQGEFPVVIQSRWVDGYGYPVSVFYGDMLLYIPAILRLAGFTILEAYKIFVMLINLGTILISRYAFGKIFEKHSTAWICTMAYVLATYRLVDVYTRQAVGEYSAMMFLPLIVLAVYGIYTADEKDWENYKNNIKYLVLGMTGLLNTHMLSMEMVVIVLAGVCVLFLKRTFRKNTIRVYIKSIIITLCLNLFYLVPFVDYFLTVPVKATRGTGAIKTIQMEGAAISQYVAFFQDPFGYAHSFGENLLSLTPGLLLMLALLYGIYRIVTKKANKVICVLTLLSMLILFAASNLFPWNWIACHIPGGSLLCQVQFPWRYLGIACALLALLLGFLWEVLLKEQPNWRKYMVHAAVAIEFFMSCFFVSSYIDGAQFREFFDTADLDTQYIGNEEYIRVGTERSNLQYKICGSNVEELEICNRRGNVMDIYCKTSAEAGEVIVPLFHYKGYQVVDENGNEYEIKDGPQNEICVSIPENFEGKLEVRFVIPGYWRVAEVISLATLGGCLLIEIKNWKKRKKNAE